MGLLPASPKACSDSCRAVNHNLEYLSHPKRSKRCDVVTRIKKHQKFSSQIPLAFLVLQELFWIRFGKERGSPSEFVGEKDQKALTFGVFVVADPVVCLIALNSQPKAY